MDRINRAVSAIRRRTDFVPEIAVVLGSGLGDFADAVRAECILPYGEIDGFPVSTVHGHAGRLVFGTLLGIKLAVMQGRIHYYEGYTMPEVVLPVRVLRMLGAQKLLLTNAAGGINKSFRPGDLMLITDHIRTVPDPLIGANLAGLGTRFPDCSSVYDPKLRLAVLAAAAECGAAIRQGVYLQTTGPSFETPAEINCFRALGADAVGMSTAVEAVAAVHAGLRVAGISCISNAAAGVSDTPLTHEEVNRTTARVKDGFIKLMTAAIAKIHAVG
ncbi:MAG: purine-nucleoside phosphorylase [Clostridiales bacterium]|jgi:purine-nucleoside phosphorylase|nr:purine-nucleoside phosphorylase [Clostridiales bacterium]